MFVSLEELYDNDADWALQLAIPYFVQNFFICIVHYDY